RAVSRSQPTGERHELLFESRRQLSLELFHLKPHIDPDHGFLHELLHARDLSRWQRPHELGELRQSFGVETGWVKIWRHHGAALWISGRRTVQRGVIGWAGSSGR